MSGTTVDDLPNEVTIKILRYLSQEDLLNATLTCKLWNDLIESSCPFSVELRYNNKVDVDEPGIDFMLSTNRKFGTIKLNEILFADKDKTLEMFQKHGFNVVRLWLIGSCIHSFTNFAEVLKCMPNLKRVHILETAMMFAVNDVPPNEDLPELRKLETLEMVSSEYRIVKCFQRAKLATLKVFNSYHPHALDCAPLEDFLKSQPMLTTLALRSIKHDTSMLFRTDKLNGPMPFHLTQLSLRNIRLRESPNDYNNLLRFLKPQAKTLKVLELGRHFPSFVFEFVFANMTKLQTFSLMMTEVPRGKEFLERLEENRSIKNLIFLDSARFGDETSQSFCAFLNKLPNVHSLNVMEYCGNETLRIMAKSLCKVEALATYSFHEQLFHGVQFPNLKALQVQQLDDKIDWNEFTKAHSRLTELTVESIFHETFLNNDDIANITTNLNLQSLRLGENISADERFLEIMRTNCPNLKLLDLNKSCVPNGLMEQTGWTVLRLCDDNAIKCSKYEGFWNEDDYGGRLSSDDDVNDGWADGEGMLDPFDIHLMEYEIDDDDESGVDYYEDYDGDGGYDDSDN